MKFATILILSALAASRAFCGPIATYPQAPNPLTGTENMVATVAGVTNQVSAAQIQSSINALGADPTGVSDSAGAIQAALNSGGAWTCNGTYLIGSTLTVNMIGASGQSITGAASLGVGGNPAGRCIFQPTSSVTTAIAINGASISGGITSVAFEALTLDMTNMPAASVGFSLASTSDDAFKNVRVIGDTGKTAFSFVAGSSNILLDTVQGTNFACSGGGSFTPININFHPSLPSACVFSQSLISVSTFGAKCDGSTDDTVAFNAAITAARSLTTPFVNVVLVPSSSLGCKITSTLALPGGVVIRGSGLGLSKINAGTANMTMFSVTSVGNQIENIELNAENATSGAVISYSASASETGIANVGIDAACIGLDVNGSLNRAENVTIGAYGTGCYGVRQGNLTTYGNSVDNYYSNVNITLGPTNPATAGFYFRDGGGTFVTHSAVLYGLNGTYINPGLNQQVLWNTFDDDYIGDSNATNALLIDTNDATAIVKGIQFTAGWTSTSSGSGVKIQNTGGGSVTGIHFTGHRFYNNIGIALNILSGANISVDDSSFCGNVGTSVVSVYSGIGFFSFRNSRIGGICDGFNTTPTNGINFLGTVSNIVVSDNQFAGPTNPIVVGGSASGSVIMTNNEGVDDISATITAAATITVTTTAQYLMTGATTVSTISGPAWNGRVIHILNEGSANFTTGGNFLNALTGTANQQVTATFLLVPGGWALR